MGAALRELLAGNVVTSHCDEEGNGSILSSRAGRTESQRGVGTMQGQALHSMDLAFNLMVDTGRLVLTGLSGRIP